MQLCVIMFRLCVCLVIFGVASFLMYVVVVALVAVGRKTRHPIHVHNESRFCNVKQQMSRRRSHNVHMLAYFFNFHRESMAFLAYQEVWN